MTTVRLRYLNVTLVIYVTRSPTAACAERSRHNAGCFSHKQVFEKSKDDVTETRTHRRAAASAERLETAKKPELLITFRDTERFAARGDELSHIHQTGFMSGTNCTFLLVGVLLRCANLTTSRLERGFM